MMTKTLNDIRVGRKHLLHLIEGLTTKQLNQVPAGFNNNIIWNVTHLISAQQGICYTRAGMPITVDDKFYSPYRPDTKPNGFIDSAEIEVIKELLINSIDQLEIAYQNNVFKSYPEWPTRYGIQITSIEEGIKFLLFHDGMHIGYVIALKRLV